MILKFVTSEPEKYACGRESEFNSGSAQFVVAGAIQMEMVS